MRMLVLALGHYFQGEASPDRVERVVEEHDFAKHMIRLSFGLIVSLCNAWLFGALPCWYRMTYNIKLTLIRFTRA